MVKKSAICSKSSLFSIASLSKKKYCFNFKLNLYFGLMRKFIVARPLNVFNIEINKSRLKRVLNMYHINANQKADDKIFICKFSKNIKAKLYHIEN